MIGLFDFKYIVTYLKVNFFPVDMALNRDLVFRYENYLKCHVINFDIVTLSCFIALKKVQTVLSLYGYCQLFLVLFSMLLVGTNFIF